MNWRELPFIRMFIPFAVGIGFAILSNNPIPNSYIFIGLLFICLILSSLLSIPYKYRWGHGLLLYLFLFLAGQQIYWLHRDDQQSNHFSQYLGQTNTFVAQIQAPPTGKGKYLQFQLQVLEIIKPDSSPVTASGRLYASIARDKLTEGLNYGDLIRLNATILPTKKPVNPNSFDFSWYLKTKNCFYQTFVKAGKTELLQREQGNPVLQFANRSRQHLVQLLLHHIPGRHEAAVAIALSLGDRNYIDNELKAAYAGTGATHVLAVSGLHVGLVYLALVWLLAKMGFQGVRWWLLRISLLLVGVWSYALLTGASPSVLRAATMFSFLIVGENLQRHANIYNTLAASAFCLLWFNPSLLISPGFQLSYAAVIGIVYFQPKLYRLWFIDNWLGDYCWKLTTVSLAAQLTTLPFTLYYFHQFPLYFWLSGLVVVPAAILILPLCFLLFFLSFIAPILLWPVAQLLYGIVWLTNAVIFFVSNLPGSLIEQIWISGLSFVLMYFLLINIAAMINTKKARWFLGILSGLLLLITSFSFTRIDQQRQEKLVIYHDYDHTLIDMFYGKHALSLRDSLLEKTRELNLSANYRGFAGIKELDSQTLSSTNNNSFVFADKNWHVLKVPFKAPPNTNILFVNHCPEKKIQEHLRLDDLELVVFGAANKPWNVETWESICDSMGVATHNIRLKGAFVFTTNNNNQHGQITF